MAAAQPQRETINDAYPTEAQLASTVSLEVVLVNAGLFEPPERTAHRESVIEALQNLATAWCRRLEQMKGVITEPGAGAATLRTFGSYKLGVHTPDADIDT